MTPIVKSNNDSSSIYLNVQEYLCVLYGSWNLAYEECYDDELRRGAYEAIPF